MTFAELESLLAFTLIATVSPGGATTLATASGASFGYRRSLGLITGIACGLGSMAALSALGLSQVLIAFPALQLGMRIIGSLYLLWLAVQLARRGPPHLARGGGSPKGIVNGVWLVWQNPKGWAMTTSASAAYAGSLQAPGRMAVLMAVIFGIMAIFSLSLWCAAGQALSRALKTGFQWRVLNGALATILALSIIPLWIE